MVLLKQETEVSSGGVEKNSPDIIIIYNTNVLGMDIATKTLACVYIIVLEFTPKEDLVVHQ